MWKFSSQKILTQNKLLFVVVLFLLFVFRLCYGLCSEFWFEDEMQVYLIGLKFFSTGSWPYFGPDIVYTQSQLPGALQGLLVGVPFFLLKLPEAPYILLNSITFFSLFFLGRYITKRIPEIPDWFIWPWIFTMPWVLNFSTHVLNPSYVLPFAILFFVAFLETVPRFRTGFLKTTTCYFIMGIALLAIFQLHMSWVLLLPYIAFSFFSTLKYNYKTFYSSILFFVLGCLVLSTTLIPTFISFGINSGAGDTTSNIVFNSGNFKDIFTVILRYFSFASFESARFLGNSTVARLEFLTQYIWLSPFIVFASIVGFAQVIWMLICLFKKTIYKEWNAFRLLIGLSTLLIWISFFFSVKGPSSHTFYVMFPLIVIYSFYCWNSLLQKKWIRKITLVFLISGFVFNVCVAINNYSTKSMYTNREKPYKAVQQKNYKILGERRSYDRNS